MAPRAADTAARGRPPARQPHTTDLDDGYDWARLHSVTEQGDLDEFLATAELAGTEFTAERRNVSFVAEARSALPDEAELAAIRRAQDTHRDTLKVPRRPAWDASTTAEELQQHERDAFLAWRRTLAGIEQREHIIMTPFERNLEVWRQLWRVLERSDLIVQIVDARNPMLFWCRDLVQYVRELSEHKRSLLMLNKADLLSDHQRARWASYLRYEGIDFVFWSAANAQRHMDEARERAVDAASQTALQRKLQSIALAARDEADGADGECGQQDQPSHRAGACAIQPDDGASWAHNGCASDAADGTERTHVSTAPAPNTSAIVTRDELLEIFRQYSGTPAAGERLTVGMVGYPNVGKSSTINVLVGSKCVAVSATPGKTKHFQTIALCDDLVLCDCPGLVFPSFVTTRAEMVCAGMLPIDQLRDCIGPMELVAQRIPRHVLEQTYGIRIVRPAEGEAKDRAPTAHEILYAYGSMRGLMTAHGYPNEPVSARQILKDYVNGRLLYCSPPPGSDPADFQGDAACRVPTAPAPASAPSMALFTSAMRGPRHAPQYVNRVDEEFFRSQPAGAMATTGRGRVAVEQLRTGRAQPLLADAAASKKHHNRNRREKLRRLASASAVP